MDDCLVIGGISLENRLFTGTGKFSSKEMIGKTLSPLGKVVVTVALRRVDIDCPEDNVLNFIPKECVLMPNTSGARNADEAVRIARLARAVGCGDWIKIEVIKDNKYLLPDNLETLKASEILASEGFVVLPYMSPDLAMAKRMVNAGVSAVMPLGAPIGSNRGFKTSELVRIMVEELNVPVIVDAGIGKPSEAAECMEMGCAAVLVNTAIATAENPVLMASAFSDAVRAGRKAFLAGTSSVTEANPSSPLTGFLRS